MSCFEMDDADGGDTQELLRLEEGFWRIRPTSSDIYPCPLAKACVGNLVFANDGDSYCGEGYTGPLCGVCDPDGFYFNPEAKACESCTKGSPLEAFFSPTIIVMLVVASFALVGAAIAYRSGALAKLKKKAQGSASAMKKTQQKGNAITKVLKGMFGDGSMKVNKDGSVTLKQVKVVEAPAKKEEHVEVMNTPLVNITTVTKLETKASLTTVVEVTASPSNQLLSMIRDVRKAQVKLKTLTSFGQIRYSFAPLSHISTHRLLTLSSLLPLAASTLPSTVVSPCRCRLRARSTQSRSSTLMLYPPSGYSADSAASTTSITVR